MVNGNMEDRRSKLQEDLACLERKGICVLKLSASGLILLETSRDPQLTVKFEATMDLINVFMDQIRDLLERCFQLNTRQCVICQKFSPYYTKYKKVWCIMDCLILEFMRRIFQNFLSPSPPFLDNLNEARRKAYPNLWLQDGLDEAQPNERCGCVELPRQQLDQLQSKAAELRIQYIR